MAVGQTRGCCEPEMVNSPSSVPASSAGTRPGPAGTPSTHLRPTPEAADKASWAQVHDPNRRNV